MFKERLNILALITKEVNKKMGYIDISVCASSELVDKVYRVSRTLYISEVNLDFIEENFE